MITLTTPFTPEFTPYLPSSLPAKRTLYFDIETTGLSAQSSYVYLIGCAYEEEETYSLTQWMTTDPAEEKELLRLFFEKAKAYDLLLHYNGTGFDLPFLEKKAQRHCLSYPLSDMESLDLYAVARKLKNYLPTEDLKLKSMEQFFGLSRTDTFSGGELIEVYAQFLGLYRLNEMTNHGKEREVTALGHVLLLHNAEDIKNLPSLTVLLFLQNLSSYLSEQSISPVTVSISDSDIRNAAETLTIQYTLPFSFPKFFSFELPWETFGLTFSFTETGIFTLMLPLFRGELKHFYPNPADYYYLPMEDCAMHKSVASFVEKEFRKKATAATCYSKKAGIFLPLATMGKTKKEAQKVSSLPCFLSDYKSNYAYTLLTEDLPANPQQLHTLVCELLDSLL